MPGFLKGAIAALAMMALTSAVNAAVVYDNGAPNGASGYEAANWLVANDFGFDSNTEIGGAGIYVADFTTRIDTWIGIGTPLEWTFFSDAGGAPSAAPLASGIAQNMSITDTGVAWGFGGNAFLAEFDLGTNFTALAGATYWLAIHLDDEFDHREDV